MHLRGSRRPWRRLHDPDVHGWKFSAGNAPCACGRANLWRGSTRGSLHIRVGDCGHCPVSCRGVCWWRHRPHGERVRLRASRAARPEQLLEQRERRRPAVRGRNANADTDHLLRAAPDREHDRCAGMGECVLPSPAISALSSSPTIASYLAASPTAVAAPTAPAAQPATVIAITTVIATDTVITPCIAGTVGTAVHGLADCVPSVPIGRTGLLPHPRCLRGDLTLPVLWRCVTVHCRQ